MPVEVQLTVSGDSPAAALRSLEGWLAGRDELRGRARALVTPPGPSEMGSAADALAVALGPGGVATGVATALASVLVSWIRRQRGKLSLTVKRSDGAEFTLSADHVRGLTTEQIPPLIGQLTTALQGTEARALDDGGDATPGRNEAGG